MTGHAVAPPCPSWCTQEHATDGWDRVGLDTTKMCRFEVPVDVEDDCWVTVERYACVSGGRIELEPVEIRVSIDEAFSPADVVTLAGALHRAIDAAR